MCLEQFSVARCAIKSRTGAPFGGRARLWVRLLERLFHTCARVTKFCIMTLTHAHDCVEATCLAYAGSMHMLPVAREIHGVIY